MAILFDLTHSTPGGVPAETGKTIVQILLHLSPDWRRARCCAAQAVPAAQTGQPCLPEPLLLLLHSNLSLLVVAVTVLDGKVES
jgi:hypothetical protein